MLLKILPCTEQPPTTEGYLVPDIISAAAEKLSWESGQDIGLISVVFIVVKN